MTGRGASILALVFAACVPPRTPDAATPDTDAQSSVHPPRVADAGAPSATLDVAPTHTGADVTNPCARGAPQTGDFEPKEHDTWLVSCPVNSGAEKTVRDKLLKAYPAPKDYQVEANFGCSPVGAVDAIIYERDDRPAPTTWLVRRKQDGSFSVLRFQYRLGAPVVTVRIGERAVVKGQRLRIARGTIDAARMERLIPELRAYIDVRLRKLELPSKGQRFASGHASLSGDVSHFVQLIDEAGNIAQRYFRGGHTSINAPQRIPMEALVAALRPVLAEAKDSGDDFTQDERRYLSKWLFRNRQGSGAVPRADAASRVIRVAGTIRWRETIPALLAAIQYAPDNDWEAKTHDTALELLAGLTQWDARKGPDGGQRPRNQVTRDYVVSCSALWNIEDEGYALPPVAGEPAE